MQFAGPIKPEWYDEMLATGVEVVNYIPNNAYLVHGDGASLSRVRLWASRAGSVQWDGEYREEFKQDPQLAAQRERSEKEQLAANAGLQRKVAGSSEPARAARQAPGYVLVQLFKDPGANSSTLALVKQVAGQQSVVVRYDIARFVNVTVKLPRGMTADEFAKHLAGSSDIVYIGSYVMPRKFDERQDNIVAGNITGNAPTATNYLTYLAGKGFTQGQFTTSNFAVNVVDSGIDNATTTPNHFALRLGGDITGASRVIFARLEGTPNAGSTLQGCDGHGNLNAHIVAGFVATGALGGVNFAAFPHQDAAGFRYGLGVAPFVKVGSTVIFDPNSFTFPSYPSIESKAYNDGARISTNSWGASVGGAYNADSQAYDFLVRDSQPAGAPFPAAGNQEMVIVFAAGNDGSGANTVGSPGTAKNVIT
ncbi:MAG: S8 family serine peptidase, partial [Pseudomonadota bacterium]